MLTPEQEQRQLLGAINNLNKEAFHLNKAIAPNEGIKSVPLAAGIPTNLTGHSVQPQHIPEPQHIPQPPPPPPVQHVQPVQQPVQDLTPLIDRITSLEKQVTRFVNLIERNVAKNAKEINIRIKLNENNDSPDSK